MIDDSRFFSDTRNFHPASPDELIYSSPSGWSEIRHIDRDGRFFACKSLKEEFRGKAKYESLLRKEYEICCPLSHPSVRSAYGFEDIPPYGNSIILEYVNGLPLSRLLEAGRLPEKQARNIALQLCDALAYLHSNQIIHRDVKPSNILITHNGGYVKLIDFSLADSDGFAIHKTPAGTPSFVAPEVVAGGPSGPESDIWSFGRTLELLLPSEKRLIRKCTQKDMARRPQSFTEIRKVLERRRRPYGRIILPILITAAIACAALLNSHSHSADIQKLPAPVTDTLTIDEIFRQATDMVGDRDGQ